MAAELALASPRVRGLQLGYGDLIEPLAIDRYNPGVIEQVMRKVRALPPEQNGDIPAVALTAYARAEDRVTAIRAGFQMHAAKPVEPNELLAMVATLVRKRTVAA